MTAPFLRFASSKGHELCARLHFEWCGSVNYKHGEWMQFASRVWLQLSDEEKLPFERDLVEQKRIKEEERKMKRETKRKEMVERMVKRQEMVERERLQKKMEREAKRVERLRYETSIEAEMRFRARIMYINLRMEKIMADVHEPERVMRQIEDEERKGVCAEWKALVSDSFDDELRSLKFECETRVVCDGL